MPATDQAVQNFFDQRFRPRAEQIRNLVAQMQDDIAAIGDVYANLTASNPPSTFVDNRADVPHKLVINDGLAMNAFLHNAVTNLTGDSAWGIVQSACVRPILG